MTIPQAIGPGRASPVPAATIDTFRAPYAEESFTAASQDLHRFHGLRPDGGGSALPDPYPKAGYINDAAGFALCYGPHLRSPFTGLLTLGFDPARFQTEPPACYRAPW